MNLFKLSIIVLAALVLVACGIAVPADKAAYVGEWKGEAMTLLITQDGSVAYERMQKGATTSINGPLKNFTGDNFEVGIGPMASTFRVSAPPHQVDGQWLMTVDGVELVRTESR